MSKPIKAKVARILNSREIVITAGTEDGVAVDMYFDVMDPNGEDIKDPDTGEILGSIQRPKVRVKVTQAHEKLSVAMTYKKKEVNVGGSSSAFDIGLLSRTLMPPKYVTKYETLKTTEKTWEDLSEEESYVKTGDPVIQVLKPLPEEE
ncbi:hypothetical protein QWY82_09685 [Simiduia curdlanivorans]|uniref:Uncharacterized protein n=1 Tax=Simiduia curdlanivorans TaxID=1492769 RepID=A0ABV8V742_9GAMM|nr:hypothetical protein [Simiduia curdlanivorans]MDN3639078.1 hypothetical protein [Simiduia curdlanivorans]